MVKLCLLELHFEVDDTWEKHVKTRYSTVLRVWDMLGRYAGYASTTCQISMQIVNNMNNSSIIHENQEQLFLLATSCRLSLNLSPC